MEEIKSLTGTQRARLEDGRAATMEKRRQETERYKAERERKEAEAYEAGWTWAAEVATYEQIEKIAADTFGRSISEFIPAGLDRDAFIQGVKAVFKELQPKDVEKANTVVVTVREAI